MRGLPKFLVTAGDTEILFLRPQHLFNARDTVTGSKRSGSFNPLGEVKKPTLKYLGWGKIGNVVYCEEVLAKLSMYGRGNWKRNLRYSHFMSIVTNTIIKTSLVGLVGASLDFHIQVPVHN